MASRSYVQLVRENREFRQLWIAAVISMLGEWFNTIALFFLILEYTGSESVSYTHLTLPTTKQV